MDLKSIFFLNTLLINVYASNTNTFITDYFRYKKPPSVIGFTCNEDEDDISLLREFTNMGVTAILKKLSYEPPERLLPDTTYWKLGIFFDIRCYDDFAIDSLFSEATEYRMFDELHYWLLLASNLTEALNIIDDRAFGLSTDFAIAVPYTIHSDSYSLYDVYNMYKDRGALLNVTYLGSWNGRGSLGIRLWQGKLVRRSNLHKISLKAAFFKNAYRPDDVPLDEYFDDFEHATRDSQSKFGFQILRHLSELYNFT